MSGIYIHIPFCKQACHYCNFHFSTSMKYKDEMLTAIHQEIALQQNYLKGKTIETIYFGGGTPSLLSSDEILRIFEALHRFYDISETVEVTLEANPDDLTLSKIEDFRKTPINRFSIGIQSFHDVDLKYMNRAHNASEADVCIQNVQSVGFDNLTIDLIYGTPTMNDEAWIANMERVFDLKVPHISCYALTVEPQTALDIRIRKGKSQAVNEEQAARQFEQLVAATEREGFDHYEISNFGKEGFYSKHNSSYWKGKPYLGLGPSAHSFNGTTRQWNVAHNMKYLKAIDRGEVPFELEELSLADRYNEYIMTGLRTIWGVELSKIETFGAAFSIHFLKLVEVYLREGLVIRNDGQFKLSAKGKFLADGIASELFV